MFSTCRKDRGWLPLSLKSCLHAVPLCCALHPPPTCSSLAHFSPSQDRRSLSHSPKMQSFAELLRHNRSNSSSNPPPPSYTAPPPPPSKEGLPTVPEKSPSAYHFQTANSLSSPPPPRLASHLKSRSLLALQVLSPPVLAILIVLITLIITTTGAHVQVDGAKREILAGCASAQKALAALRAVPEMLEEKSRETSIEAVEVSVRGVGKALILALTVIEALISFLVDTYQATYLCCFQFVIFGGLALLIGAVEEVRRPPSLSGPSRPF